MGAVTRFAAAVGFAGAAAALCAFPAEAGCKRMAFSVNDYGKDGPTKDSQDLLDKHIATWAAEQGIEKYTVGKKDVTCELFLNLIVVDEHTCTARATVCWGGDKPPGSGTQEAKKKDPAKTAAKADAAGDAAAAAKPEAAKETKPDEAKAGGATPAAAQVETGALPLTNKPADTAGKTAEATDKPADKPAGDSFTVSERDAVAAAAAAAERAAAAAERAAAAAERAAAAATEANANAARAQAASSSTGSSNSTGSSSSAAPEPPAFGAASQPIVAPIQPDTSKQ